MHPRIMSVRVVGPHSVELAFTDGARGVVDLGPKLAHRGGVFELLRDPAYFACVSVDEEAGTISWPNGIDLDPDVLYEAVLTAGARK